MPKKDYLQEKNNDRIFETYKKLGVTEERIQKMILEHEAKAQIVSRKENFANIKAVEPVCLTRYRNARFIMANPLFSCDQKKRIEPIEYRFFDSEGHERFVEVTANATYGMATQRDADIIRFAISKIGEIGQRTGHYPDTIEERAYALLKAIGKNNKQGNYVWLREAVKRLSGHTIYTNAFSSDSKTTFLDTIAGFEWVEDQNQAIKKLKIRLPKQLIEAIRNRGILVIDQAVMEESGSLKKRLLELVQVHMGTKNEWEIGFDKLKDIIPYNGESKYFKKELKRCNLAYKLTFRTNSSKQQIVRFQR
ncbi:MAG: replication initiator protein A [Nostoc sp. LLA-1]|nr:replication initiator protein A [Cyanocohniella sp. LLY]